MLVPHPTMPPTHSFFGHIPSTAQTTKSPQETPGSTQSQMEGAPAYAHIVSHVLCTALSVLVLPRVYPGASWPWYTLPLCGVGAVATHLLLRSRNVASAAQLAQLAQPPAPHHREPGSVAAKQQAGTSVVGVKLDWTTRGSELRSRRRGTGVTAAAPAGAGFSAFLLKKQLCEEAAGLSEGTSGTNSFGGGGAFADDGSDVSALVAPVDRRRRASGEHRGGRLAPYRSRYLSQVWGGPFGCN